MSSAGAVVVEATHPYKPQGPHQLPLAKGELLLVLDKHPSGWWIARNAAATKGIVPSTFVRPLRLEPPSGEVIRELVICQTAFDVGIASCGGVASLSRRAAVDTTAPVAVPVQPSDAEPSGEVVKQVENLLASRERVRRRLREALESIAQLTCLSVVPSCAGATALDLPPLSACTCAERLKDLAADAAEKVASLRNKLQQEEHRVVDLENGVFREGSHCGPTQKLPCRVNGTLRQAQRVAWELLFDRASSQCSMSGSGEDNGDCEALEAAQHRLAEQYFKCDELQAEAAQLASKGHQLKDELRACVHRCQESAERRRALVAAFTAHWEAQKDGQRKQLVELKDVADRLAVEEQEMAKLQATQRALTELLATRRAEYLNLDAVAQDLRSQSRRIKQAEAVRHRELPKLQEQLRTLVAEADQRSR